jgi:hypothetical protein
MRTVTEEPAVTLPGIRKLTCVADEWKTEGGVPFTVTCAEEHAGNAP